MTIHNLMPPDVAGRLAADRELLRALRQRIADRIERDIAILDALCPDADLEPSLCGTIVGGPSYGGDDRELDEAESGIGDMAGLAEQRGIPAGVYA